MSFGKKTLPGTIRQKTATTHRGSIEPPPQHTAGVSEKSLAQQVFGMLATAALFLGFVLVGKTVLETILLPPKPGISVTQMGVSQLPAAQAQPSATTQRLMQICLPLLAARNVARPELNLGFDARLKQLGRTTTDGLARYLNCTMKNDHQRLCTDKHKAGLVAELTTYFKLIAAGQMRVQRNTKYAELNDTFSAHSWDAEREMANHSLSSTNLNPAQQITPNENTITAMRELISHGYLSTRDFGWSTPQEVSPYLKNLSDNGSACK